MGGVGHPRARGFFQNAVQPLRRPNPVDAVDQLEKARALDGPSRSLAVVLRRLLRPGRIKDLLHGVPTGHPAHPALTDIPVGCWISAAVLDLVPGGERASRKLVAAGLVTAVPTALTGLADWSALHREQQRVGLVHAMTTAAAATLYAASLTARARGHVTSGKVLGFAGLGALLAGGYLGGHLAFRQAAGANHAESVAHLIPLGWHDLCPLDELPEEQPVHRRLGYISLFLLRTGDQVYALADGCAHLAGPLHQGRITEQDGDLCVVCPWHGSTFRVADGTVVHGPATARQPAFETRVNEAGMLQVRPAS